jgi:hypothetical protein
LTSDEANAMMTGGETPIMNPSVLNFWQNFDGYAKEEADLFTIVEPKFGRFLAFDPRFPHGVRQVRGPREMAKGRLVLHGWFSEPTPFFVGGLASAAGSFSDGDEGDDGAVDTADSRAAAAVLDAALAVAVGELSKVGRVTGCLSVRLTVAGSTGLVTAIDALADSLVADPDDWQGPIGETEKGETIYEDARSDLLLVLQEALSAAKFPIAKTGEDTEITVPFIFE